MKEKSFADLDANYRSPKIGNRELEFHDAFAAPFVLCGLPYVDAEGHRSRLPLEVARQCLQESVLPMSRQTAGAIIRFRTNSPYVGIRAAFDEVWLGVNYGGSGGFDLYTGNGANSRFCGNRAVQSAVDFFEALFEPGLPGADGMHDCTLYLPYHCAVSALTVGLVPGSAVEAPRPFRIEKPVVFYGSSITNCASAARPSMLYPSIIARMMDFNHINMGFAGSCCGELPIADTIIDVDPSVLVMEFDHNAPTPEFLAAHHEPFFRRFRAGRPQTPVLMMSMCDFTPTENKLKRRAIIMRTYLNAFESGDRFVDFLDGETLFAGMGREECTQDTCHPNDYGCMVMAKRIADRLQRWLR